MRIRWVMWLWTTAALLLSARGALAYIPRDLDLNGIFGSWSNDTAASIRWEQGKETLDLIPAIPADAGSGWVIDLPARNSEVTVHWLKTAPYLQGRTSESALRRRLDVGTSAVWVTQVYPIFYWIMFPRSYARTSPPESAPPLEMDSREGLGFCLPSIIGAEALKREVERSGIKIANEDLRKFSLVADGTHTFLMVYPPSVDAYREVLGRVAVFNPGETPCLEITFPSKRPMMPRYASGGTAYSFGRQVIGVTGDVNWVSPPPASNEASIRLMWCRGNWVHGQTYDQNLVAYTRVVYEGQPGPMTFDPLPRDLAAAADHYYDILAQPAVLWGMVLAWTAVISYLSGGLAGLVVARRWEPYARAGLWNLGTILALWFQFERKKWRGMWVRTRIFLVVFALIFAGFNLGLSHLLTAWLGEWHF